MLVEKVMNLSDVPVVICGGAGNKSHVLQLLENIIVMELNSFSSLQLYTKSRHKVYVL